ncbi:MAG TPA: DUF692 domain-containing protein [Tepidisphaeraceae bacterium]|jgi:hypothetical protein
MNTATLTLGLGIGWRPHIALAIDRMSDLGFVEITAENFDAPARLPRHLHVLRSRGLAVVPHGISLSLGGAERVDPARVRHLAELARELGSPLVSEHIAFVRAVGHEAGHLLPIPRTHGSLHVLVDNIRAAQDLLPVPLALENISALFDWPERDFDEADFLAAVVDRTGVGLLLDVANVYANHRNLGTDPATFIDRIPLERIAYVHMGGGFENDADGVYHDTHAHDVPAGALDLLQTLAARAPLPGVMLERDDNFPDERHLNAEMDRIRAALSRARNRNAHRETHA